MKFTKFYFEDKKKKLRCIPIKQHQLLWTSLTEYYISYTNAKTLIRNEMFFKNGIQTSLHVYYNGSIEWLKTIKDLEKYGKNRKLRIWL